LHDEEKGFFKAIQKEQAPLEKYQTSLAKLCDYLHRYYNTKVLLLLCLQLESNSLKS
jgi:hypothetical protein